MSSSLHIPYVVPAGIIPDDSVHLITIALKLHVDSSKESFFVPFFVTHIEHVASNKRFAGPLSFLVHQTQMQLPLQSHLGTAYQLRY